MFFKYTAKSMQPLRRTFFVMISRDIIDGNQVYVT